MDVIRLEDGLEEIVNLNRRHTFEGQPMIERTKDFVQSEIRDMSTSTALLQVREFRLLMMKVKFLKLDSFSKTIDW